jgi:hypothetical protein
MHTQFSTSNTSPNVATRFVCSENVSRTSMTRLEVADLIGKGAM